MPYTLLGLAFGFASLQVPRARHGLLVFHSRRGFAWPFLVLRGFAAVTFGRVVIAAERPLPPETLVHEQHHALQYERLGPLFLPVYLYWHLRRGYWGNPLELAAAWCAEHWRIERG